MNKEEILALAKELVLFIRDHGEEGKKDKAKAKWFGEKTLLLKTEAGKLNFQDMLWLDNTYSKWLRETFSK
jgi:hypothetical protein